MEEEIIISGRMNPMVDPTLNLWGWEIAFYLFAGGLAGQTHLKKCNTVRIQ